MISQKFRHFLLKAIFVSLSQKILTKKVFFFLPFSQEIVSLSKIWYQKWILWLISFPEMYTFIYISVIIWKLQHSICLKKMGSHPLNKRGALKSWLYLKAYIQIYTLMSRLSLRKLIDNFLKTGSITFCYLYKKWENGHFRAVNLQVVWL